MRRYKSLALAVFVLEEMSGAAPAEPMTPYQQDLTRKFTRSSPLLYVQGRCGPRERECQIGPIYWCCRADQQCDYRYAGGCR